MKKSALTKLGFCLTFFLIFSGHNYSVASVFAQGDTLIPTPAIPSDLRPDGQESTSSSTEASESNSNPSSSTSNSSTKGLLDVDVPIYSVIGINSDKYSDFKKYLETNDATKGQYKLKEKQITDQGIILEVTYSDTAKENKQPILYYVETGFTDKKEAEEFSEQMLELYPDLLNETELKENNQKYDVVFSLNIITETQMFAYNATKKLIEYSGDRQPFDYVVKEGEEDQTQALIEEKFPGAFDFQVNELSDGKKQVTVIPLNISHSDTPESESDNETSVEEEEVTTTIQSTDRRDSQTGQVDFNQLFSNPDQLLAMTKDSLLNWWPKIQRGDTFTIYLTAVIIILIGLILIVISRR